MLREETVFGPIHSRRLGSSLGINLLPENGKWCNFDCIYCECGWNRDGLNDKRLPTVQEVHDRLEAKLADCLANGITIDSITFSGDGEPTLHPHFAEIIDVVLALRDKLYPKAVVSVLSNATRVHIPEVFKALCKVNNPIMKIDAPTNALAEHINHPATGYDVSRVVEALMQFDGNFVLQTMFLRSKDFNSAAAENLNGWMEIVRKTRPREIMVYTIDRPTPETGLVKFTPEEMRQLTQPLANEGFKIQIKG